LTLYFDSWLACPYNVGSRFGWEFYDMTEEPFDKVEDHSLGGVRRHVVSVSFNKGEYEKLQKLQALAPVSYLRNNLSAFIKFLILE
jgi:hypothetical protein